MELTYENLVNVINEIPEELETPCNSWGCVSPHYKKVISKSTLEIVLAKNFKPPVINYSI